MSNDPTQPDAERTLALPHQPGGAPAFPGYDQVEEIGRGGVGVVYRAWNRQLQRYEALKILRSGASERDLARFRFEAEATAALVHDHILPIYGTEEHAGQFVLITPWMPGGTLARQRDKYRGRWRWIAALVSLLARAVHHAHQRGILHRDLKPANILLDEVGEPRVADFGLARWLDQSASQASGTIAGTPAYMAPEQARGDRDLSVAVDVYGLGGILYYLLTGHAPFAGESPAEVLVQVLGQEPLAPHRLEPGVDRDLEAVCLKCLQKSPQDRYASALALAEDLESYLAGRGVSARPLSVWDWVRQALRREPPPAPYTWAVPAALAVLLVTADLLVLVCIVAECTIVPVWATLLVTQVLIWAIVWYGSLARFREVPVTQHTSALVALGYWLGLWAVLFGMMPLEPSAAARAVVPIYPALLTVAAFTFFALGIVFWGRLLLAGLGLFALAAVLRWTGDLAPLVSGASIAVTLLYWASVTSHRFVPRE